MASSQVRAAARRSVVEAQADRRRHRKEREDKIAALTIEVNMAPASRRAAIDSAELRAGRALGQMFAMGLTTSEAVEWCAGGLNAKEVGRLRRVPEASSDQSDVISSEDVAK